MATKSKKMHSAPFKTPLRLNIGCGPDLKSGYINLDGFDYPNLDVKHNLNQFPYPFKDNTFEEILCSHVIEHLDPQNHLQVFKELHRISKPGAVITIKVPHFSAVIAKTHLTHYKLFGFRTLDVICDNIPGPEKYLRGYFKEISKEIYFNKMKGFCKLFSIDHYERFISRLIPALEVEIKLQVIKHGKT